jgi:hypothetical protein
MPISLADQLFVASNDDSLSEAELRAWMRRAAHRIEAADRPGSAVLVDADVLSALDELADDSRTDRTFTVNAILRDWLIQQGHLPLDELDEE